MMGSKPAAPGLAWYEGVAAGAAGALLGAGTLSWSDWWLFGAVIGGVNGVVSGSTRIYEWRAASGRMGFLLDSTWGLVGTTSAVVTHLVNAVWPNAGYLRQLSERSGVHVYRRGLVLRPGFVVTLGNVVTGATYRLDETDPARVARRRQLIERHEAWHAWQSRIWGPLFQLGYGIWLLGGAIVGAAVGLVLRKPIFKSIETLAYYNNPFEVSAYKRDDNWPPAGGVRELMWGGRRSIRPE